MTCTLRQQLKKACSVCSGHAIPAATIYAIITTSITNVTSAYINPANPCTLKPRRSEVTNVDVPPVRHTANGSHCWRPSIVHVAAQTLYRQAPQIQKNNSKPQSLLDWHPCYRFAATTTPFGDRGCRRCSSDPEDDCRRGNECPQRPRASVFYAPVFLAAGCSV